MVIAPAALACRVKFWLPVMPPEIVKAFVAEALVMVFDNVSAMTMGALIVSPFEPEFWLIEAPDPLLFRVNWPPAVPTLMVKLLAVLAPTFSVPRVIFWFKLMVCWPVGAFVKFAVSPAACGK